MPETLRPDDDSLDSAVYASPLDYDEGQQTSDDEESPFFMGLVAIGYGFRMLAEFGYETVTNYFRKKE